MLVLGQLQRRLASVGRQHYALAAFKTTMAPAISVRASLPLAPAGTQFRKRELSSYSQSNSRSLRAFPQYTIYGVGCVLSVKMISPKFRLVKGDSLAIDPTQKGRILLEFTPQNGQDSPSWVDQVRFGMSAEEVGLLLSQMPHHGVEFSRRPPNSFSMGDTANGTTNDESNKVLTAVSGEGATVIFTLDFVKNGVGGQPQWGPGKLSTTPLTVVVEAGEFEVMKAILSSSLPHLVGWTKLMEINAENTVSEAMNGGGDGPKFNDGRGRREEGGDFF